MELRHERVTARYAPFGVGVVGGLLCRHRQRDGMVADIFHCITFVEYGLVHRWEVGTRKLHERRPLIRGLIARAQLADYGEQSVEAHRLDSLAVERSAIHLQLRDEVDA